MKSDLPENLPDKCVEAIKTFIKENSEVLNCNEDPIGDKVFDIIKRRGCIVIFYPLGENEENDAFLLSDVAMRNSDFKNLVVINTSQTVEKQVFAAGHELGHLLNVHKYVCDFSSLQCNQELVVNRFAAELLMPEKLFDEYIRKELHKRDTMNNHRIRLDEAIRSILNAMDHFKVPYNSVVIRMLEVGAISRETAKSLVDGNNIISKQIIETIKNKIKSESEYTSIQAISSKKEIAGLEELLDEVEKKGLLQNKIDRLRKAFDIVPESEQNREIKLDL